MPHKDDYNLLLTDQLSDTDPQAAQELKQTLHALCLPIPDVQHCLRRAHGDYLLPVTAAGVTLHISRSGKARPPLLHEQILQPLGTYDTKYWHIRIMPGVALNATDQECASLRAKLREDGINFHDDVLANVGNLPHVTPEYPNGLPVVIDANAAHPFSSHTPQTHAGVQDQLYAALRHKLSTALNAATPEETHKAMRPFWKLCTQHRITESDHPPTLVAGWQNVRKQYGDDGKSRDVKDIAAAYSDDVGRYWRNVDKENLRAPRGDKQLTLR